MYQTILHSVLSVLLVAGTVALPGDALQPGRTPVLQLEQAETPYVGEIRLDPAEMDLPANAHTYRIALDADRWTETTDIAYYTGENVPSEREAITIAEQYIRDNRLYPADQLGEPQATPLLSGSGEDETILCWDVYYYPKVDGRPVYGVFRIVVSVGTDGEVVGTLKLAGKYESTDEVPLKTWDDIRADLASGSYFILSAASGTDAALTHVELAYYADVESDDILPVYSLSDETGKTQILIDARQV